jgi:5-methylcytosine-specific restriction endonuclease McrA
MCERLFQRLRNARPERVEYATAEYQAARLAVLGQPCWRCGEVADTADHVKPVRHGGTWRDGLRPACRRCNSDWSVA